MVTTVREAKRMTTGDDDDLWLYYTDIYQHYQFRYPATFTVMQEGENVHLRFDHAGQANLDSTACFDCRFVIYKPQVFHDLIDLEEYLKFQDRQKGLPPPASRSPIPDLQPRYRGMREIVEQVDGMIYSILHVSFKTRIMPIHAVVSSGTDLDIQLARTVRFF